MQHQAANSLRVERRQHQGNGPAMGCADDIGLIHAFRIHEFDQPARRGCQANVQSWDAVRAPDPQGIRRANGRSQSKPMHGRTPGIGSAEQPVEKK
jgi:hypothetical protein